MGADEAAEVVGEAGRWVADLERLHERIGRRFFRPEPRRRALGYLRGLLSEVERKNGWQLAEVAGEATPDGVQRLLATARWDAAVPATWVTGDEVYGSERRLRRWLEQHHQPFVLTVSSREALWIDRPGLGPAQVSAARIRAMIPADAWERISAGDGAKGPRLYDCARVPLARWPERKHERWLLIRRSLTDQTARGYAYCVVYAPTDTPLETLVRVAGTR